MIPTRSFVSQGLEAPAADAEKTRLAAQHEAVFVALSKLPPFHPTALRLMNISVEGESAMGDFEDCFKSDPALTADLLLVANSAEFGLRSRIETIRHALSFLGLERVRSLGCTIAFSFYVRNVPRTPYMRTVWSHSLAAAVIAEELGKLNGQPAMYTAGLIHDLGRLALFLSVGLKYAESMTTVFDGPSQAFEKEKEQFGMTHSEAGGIICEKWRFPESLSVCMTTHHEPSTGSLKEPTNIIKAACAMADGLGYPEIRLANHENQLQIPGEIAPDRLRAQIDRLLATVGRM
jgi:HD-like signal output (HDOD) protein